MKTGFQAISILWVLATGSGSALEPIPQIDRRLPPMNGVAIPVATHAELSERTESLKEAVWEVDFKTHAADVGVLVKAVEYALDHGEFYSEKEIPVATEMLDLAEARLKELREEDEVSWLQDRGLVVRGYVSSVDESYQPYGLEIPEGLDLSEPVPLLVWLHGRGDKVTDLHFLKRCLSKSQALGGYIADQEKVIVLHPFGRQCVGWKHAGEIDVFESIATVMKDYPIDPNRIALAGFSMGGAGAWHIGAHYADQFCAVHAGAGFVETKEYNKLAPEQFPANHVQMLWRLYDVPAYTRNLLNIPLLAYSGAEDKQKQASDLMARELKSVGHELRHVVGEGMGHRYNEESVAEIWKWLCESWEQGRVKQPDSISWQTPTLRYPGFQWLQISGLEAHWKGATANALWNRAEKEIEVETENISAFSIIAGADQDLSGVKIKVGRQLLQAESPGFQVEGMSFVKRAEKWEFGEREEFSKKLGIQGPIDDAFMSRFVVVPPDVEPQAKQFARWLEFELGHFRSRWKALMRGQFLEETSDELNGDDFRESNLILWGDPESNKMIAEIADRLPVKWKGDRFEFGGNSYSRNEAVPVFIFPNPLNPDRYVVLNSGITFRENHDKTNSQQNPKLPDWAVIGLDQLPDAEAPGRIIEAGFFDEDWR